MKRPWIKFYTSDWRADPRLRMCSLSARGLWIDLISYMAEGEPFGHLTINGISPDLAGIAGLVGRPIAEVRKAIVELSYHQVCSTTEGGVIFSRRMVRDHQKAQEGLDAAVKRWEKSKTPNGSPNGSPNGCYGKTPNTQKLEARTQRSEDSSELASPPSPNPPNLDFIPGFLDRRGEAVKNFPRHGARSGDGRFVYFKRGTDEFAAYSEDFREATGDTPGATSDGRWFKFAGSAAGSAARGTR